MMKHGSFFSQIAFILTGVPYSNSVPVRGEDHMYTFSNTACNCATDPYCLQPQQFYAYRYIQNNQVFTPVYTVPGSFLGCFVVDSLLFSTLECYYSNSDCLSTLVACQNTSQGAAE